MTRSLVVFLFVLTSVTCLRASQTDWPQFKFVQVATGLNYPSQIISARDGSGRMFICESFGIRILHPNGALSVFLDLGKRLTSGGRRLSAVAFPPDYTKTKRFYVLYSRSDKRRSVVSRFQTMGTDPDRAEPKSEEVLLEVGQYSAESGEFLAFGPDGFLYIGLGDTSHESVGSSAQDPLSLRGKMLRIDVESPKNGYRVPKDNPFVGDSKYCPEIWAMGLKSPSLFSFDRATGNLYLPDLGVTNWEVNFHKNGSIAGKNYGWPYFDGTSKNNDMEGNPKGFALPATEQARVYSWVEITGGVLYRGPSSKRLNGLYIYGDNQDEVNNIGAIARENNQWVDRKLDKVPVAHISALGEDELGRIYVAGIDGEILRVEDSGQTAPPEFDLPSTANLSNKTGVRIASFSPGATIYYTTDGSTPTEKSRRLGEGEVISFDQPKTITAIAVRDGSVSDPVVAHYDFQMARPQIEPSTPYLEAPTFVSLKTETQGATIHYSIDRGEEKIYSAPFKMVPQSTLHVTATKPNYKPYSISHYYSFAIFENAGVTTLQHPDSLNWLEMEVNSNGDRFFTSFSEPCIYRTRNGVTELIAGSKTFHGQQDGPALSARFTGIVKALYLDPAENLLIADGPRIRMLSKAGIVTTLREVELNGESLESGDFDPAGNFYCITNGSLYRLDTNGKTTLITDKLQDSLPGSPGVTCSPDPRFPVYITSYSEDIYRISNKGKFERYTRGPNGYLDGPKANAEFTSVSDISFDNDGNLYATGYSRIRKISTTGAVSTVAGSGDSNQKDGPARQAGFYMATNIQWVNGVLYVNDAGFDGTSVLRKIILEN